MLRSVESASDKVEEKANYDENKTEVEPLCYCGTKEKNVWYFDAGARNQMYGSKNICGTK